LLLAVNEYFANPSYEILERLFNACNLMDTSAMPHLTRAEKIILRASEQTDLFEEKFRSLTSQTGDQVDPVNNKSAATLLPTLAGNSRNISVPKDTHFFETQTFFENVKVPIRIPMTTFEEDVGDVSGGPSILSAWGGTADR
jgi:hypothetical protein